MIRWLHANRMEYEGGSSVGDDGEGGVHDEGVERFKIGWRHTRHDNRRRWHPSEACAEPRARGALSSHSPSLTMIDIYCMSCERNHDAMTAISTHAAVLTTTRGSG